jgi:FkbM family methyltransferase
VSTAAWYFRLPDFEDMLFALHLLRPKDLFVDGGANTGVWSVLAASTGADVLAVEPAPETFALLQRQAALNQVGGQVHCVQCALAAEAKTLWITTGLDSGNHVVDIGQSGATAIPAVTLDQLCRDRPATLIKLDLEGYELEALRGAVDVFANPALLAVIVETFRPHNWRLEYLQAIDALMSQRGFRPYGYQPEARAVFPITAPEQSGQNTIYLRDGESVRKRLLAGSVVSLGQKRW